MNCISIGQLLSALIGAYLSLVLFRYCKQMMNLARIPGPFALPLVGHLYKPEVILIMKYFSSCRRRYGRFFQFWPGNTPVLVVAHPEAVRKVRRRH